MNYGGTLESEQEVVVRLDRTDGQAHICSTWPAWSRKLERRYGAPRKVTEREGKVTSAFWTLPLEVVRLHPTKKRAQGGRGKPFPARVTRQIRHDAPTAAGGRQG